jgi:hypothetical protein
MKNSLDYMESFIEQMSVGEFPDTDRYRMYLLLRAKELIFFTSKGYNCKQKAADYYTMAQYPDRGIVKLIKKKFGC